jgi:superfamily I DNA/RNA helicase
MQQLYEREHAPLEGWVRLQDDTNYRTPRSILEAVNRWLAPPQPVAAGSPFEGEPVEVLEYEDAAGLVEKTRRAITLALQAKFRRQDIALVTFAGRERSRILPFDALGPHRLRSFQGRYDILGEPEFGEGDILAETVYRFKGQSAPCVILTEVDFESLDERSRRKLFTGMTRASLKLFVVMSRRSASLLPLAASRPS